MKAMRLLLVAVVALSVLAFGFGAGLAREPKILEFNSMVGVPSTLTGAQNPIPLASALFSISRPFTRPSPLFLLDGFVVE